MFTCNLLVATVLVALSSVASLPGEPASPTFERPVETTTLDGYIMLDVQGSFRHNGRLVVIVGGLSPRSIFQTQADYDSWIWQAVKHHFPGVASISHWNGDTRRVSIAERNFTTWRFESAPKK